MRGSQMSAAGTSAAKRSARTGRIADIISRFSGSFTFIQLHVVWFTIWIILNLVTGSRFDPFPFGLLTLIVSLKVIFLSTFVLMSQNRNPQRDDKRAEDDLRVSVLSETWAEEIGARLGIDAETVHEKAEQKLQANR